MKLPRVARRLAGPVEVLNVERDAAVVFSTDEQPPETSTTTTVGRRRSRSPMARQSQPHRLPAARATPSRSLTSPFTAGDAAQLLIAWWTKVRPDQLGTADSIESLCDGASSRRNQLLVDLGAELSLGAIDGAAEADLPTLAQTVTGLARGYRPLGPVLSATVADHLKDVLGPTGVRSAAISDRVANHWSLGHGWATHVLTRVALATRDGASTRGDVAADGRAADDVGRCRCAGRFDRPWPRCRARRRRRAGRKLVKRLPSTPRRWPPSPAASPTPWSASARELLDRPRARTSELPCRMTADDDNSRDSSPASKPSSGVTGSRLTAPAFDAERAVLLDDRWASVREDVVRIAAGQPIKADFAGAGSGVAAMARWFGLTDIAEAAGSTNRAPGPTTSLSSPAPATDRSRPRSSPTCCAAARRSSRRRRRSTRRKLAFFKKLYRSHARVGATLWVVPANMASYQDVDALVEWVSTEQTRSVGPTTQVVKPALRPTLLFPFAAGRVLGDAADAGSRAEVEARILLWSVERLVGARWHGVSETDRLHVVLPGSPNRGLFGGDGAYGETKAALDALVAKSVREPWGRRVTLAHAVIGWVRGTGLMGGNDTLVAAVEAAGVRTWTPDEMAAELLDLCTPSARRKAVEQPLHADFAAGLADVDLSGLTPGVGARRPEDERVSTASPSTPFRRRRPTSSTRPVSRGATSRSDRRTWSSSWAPASSARTGRRAPATRWRSPTRSPPPVCWSWRG